MLHGKMVIHDYQCLKITHPFCMHFHSLQHFQSIYQIYIPIFFIIELKWLAKTQCMPTSQLFEFHAYGFAIFPSDSFKHVRANPNCF